MQLGPVGRWDIGTLIGMLTKSLFQARCLSRSFESSLLLIVLMFAMLPPQAYGFRPKKVLILYSFDKEETFHYGLDQQLRTTLRNSAPARIEFYTEYLDLSRFRGRAHEDNVLDLVSLRCSAIQPDVIVAVAYPALDLLLKYGDEVCREIPIVFSYVDEQRISGIQARITKLHLENRVTGSAIRSEVNGTLQIALRLQPDTQAVYVVVGNSTFEQFWVREIRASLLPTMPQVKVSFLTDLPIHDLVAKISTLPSHSVIFFAFFGRDISGQFFSSEDVLEMLRERANSPIYSIYLPYLGHGIVGGNLTDPKVVAEETGRIVLRVLNGEDLSKISVGTSFANADTFDWRELKRWRISQHRLPRGSSLLFQEPSRWGRYGRLVIWFSLLLAAAGILIVWLLVLHRKQRQAVTLACRLEARWRSAFENAPIGFLLYELSKDRVLSANPAVIQMLGYDSTEEFQSLNFSQHICTESLGDGPLALRLAEQGVSSPVDIKLQRKDKKTISVKLRGCLVDQEPPGNVMELIIENVTQQRTLEAQFHHAQKMEAIGRLAGGIAHDFNNLLSVIIGAATMLIEKLGPHDPLVLTAGMVHKAGSSAAELTSRLLTFSRNRVPQNTAVNLNSVLAEAKAMLSHAIGEDIDLEVVPTLQACTIEADPADISNVIMNLAINSRDAMPGGGKLTIATEYINLTTPLIQDGSTIVSGRYVKLRVTDTGTGMDEETKARIFEPFFTTKPIDRGTGLGLAVVYGVVKQAGGTVCVSSAPGSGSTFEIYFPLYNPDSRLQAATIPETAVRKGKETILLVEDASLLRDFVSEGLREDGYQVMIAPDGDHALQMASNSASEIDLLVTDVRMPGMNGPELAHKLRQGLPALKVLYMSGYPDELLDQCLQPEDGTGFIKKPFDIPGLERRIREMLTCNESVA